ncbi:glycerate kinase [Thiobacter aerophilum]|uniref:Glycerate kinase n=1 Tax=Thiobacter aerophilum TaxID=3121275 RepID=A0ABV0EHB2_9BURK
MVIAPDSFKGSLTALEAAQAMASGVRRVFPAAQLRLFPLADGGEGTLDALLHAGGGERRRTRVTGADGRTIEADWGVLPDGDHPIAVIESAQVVGLALARDSDVAHRSTRGIGELIRHALDTGLTRLLIGLGGTSTNDGGAGLLTALGVRLLDDRGATLAPTPAGLARLKRVDFTGLDARVARCEFTALTDVDNPLVGPAGATATFGPQKGVVPEAIAEFDARLSRLAALCDAWAGRPVSREPGAGAAGGLGYALLLIGARREPGARVVCERVGLPQAVAAADWVLTGEGRSDAQTLHGKLPLEVARLAHARGVPVTLISGRIDEAARPLLQAHFDGCFEAAPATLPLAIALARAAQLLSDAAQEAARAYRARCH